MPDRTEKNVEKLEKNLEYIGLDLGKIPEFLLDYHPIEYRPVRGYSDKNAYRVYKYVDVRDIQILITPTNRLDSLKEKYDKATPISSYLIPEDEEKIYKHTMFLNMVKTVDTKQIKAIKNMQEEFQKGIYFNVKYFENYLWQIYYSEVSDQYFMLVPTMDCEYASFFYLLKRQIECAKKNKEYKIFVPICHMEHSGKYLRRSEIGDIENYLWLFTKDWPLAYEVYDKDQNMTLQIVGQTDIYEKIQSSYKIILKDKDEAKEFYLLLKALFILQTELPKRYKFRAKVNQEGSLDFYKDQEKIEYKQLSDMLTEDYKASSKELEDAIKEIDDLEDSLNKLKQEVKEKTAEYLEKEKEISTYLECRKTFFGKLKYFMKHKKSRGFKAVVRETKKAKEENKKVEELQNNEVSEKQKSYYTIEDVININQTLEERQTYQKNLGLDKKALEEKKKILDLKIANAKQYIDEIDKHNKSIFDFWRYTNKDNALALNEGKKQEAEENKIKLEKTFDYEEDLANLGIKVDKMQREALTKDQEDATYLTTTNVLPLINLAKKVEYKHEELEKLFNKIKEEAKKEEALVVEDEDHDIFGSISEDRTKIKMIAGKKHRESKKNEYKILDITKKIEIDQFEQRLVSLEKNLNHAIKKNKTVLSMPIYAKGTIKKDGYQTFHINPNHIFNLIGREKKINLYRFNLKQGSPAIYLTNAMYYDNHNQTLPLGMDISDEVLLDLSQYDLKLVKDDTLGFVSQTDTIEAQTKQIHLKEYDLIIKK